MSSQLLFLIIFLVVAALVVIGTLVFITRVDRSIANEGARSRSRQSREDRGDEARTGQENDEHRMEEKP